MGSRLRSRAEKVNIRGAKIGIVTGNIKFYCEAAAKLKDARKEFLSLTPDEKIPEKVEIVITTPEEKALVDFSAVLSRKNGKDAAEKAIFNLTKLRSGDKKYTAISIGIDPGKKIGIAALSERQNSGTREVLYTEEVGSKAELLSTVKKIVSNFPCESTVVKVGKKGGYYRNIIIAELQKAQKKLDFKIELVDEHRTTKINNHAKNKNIASAREIAAKKGEEIKEKFNFKSKIGEIKYIQKESREMSGNITIGRELAAKVVEGKITLEKALELQKKA